MLRRPRNDLNNFSLAKTLKFELLFSQKKFSSVRKRKIKETIQWTYNEEQLVQFTMIALKSIFSCSERVLADENIHEDIFVYME